MRGLVSCLLLAWAGFILSSSAIGQIAQPIVPLSLDGEARVTQLPPATMLGAPQCDTRGTVYLQYNVMASGPPSSAARIEPDGTTALLSLSPVEGGENHVFSFAVDNDGRLYEILRASADGGPDQGRASSDVEYVRFDADGQVRSHEALAQEFIPSAFLPLPDGSFFASGIALKENGDGVTETSLAGIFGPDAQLQRHLHADRILKTGAHEEDDGDAFLHSETVRLGDDGNIYVLLGGDHAKVAVVSQSAQIIRQMELQEPFETGVASDMWVSGGRLLVAYEGEADDPKDSFLFVLYDGRSGEVIRQYKPDFLGTPACFQDGQTLTVLVRQPLSGNVGIATAELR